MLIVRKMAGRGVLLASLVLMSSEFVFAADAFKPSKEKETELLAILRSDGPAADKALACKKLAIDGSSESVNDLAKLLSNSELASWARIALEAIPGPEADEALRKASESLEGLLLAGTINSIGIRRDAKAVEALAARLKDNDVEVACAAAVALGRIGNAAAAESLRKSLLATEGLVRSAVAEGTVLCAERLLAEGKSAESVVLYDLIRNADVPKQRVIEATRGAILARGKDGLPLLVEQLKSADKQMFQLALGTAREFPGTEIDKALVEELSRATPDRAALVIQAMADRSDTVILAVVLKSAEAGPKPVRLSAINALARVGNESCLNALLATALEEDAELSSAARTTLADLPGEKVNSQIVSLLPKAQGKSYPLLIGLVGQRRIEATAELLKAIDHSDKTVRTAALTALGETVSLKNLSVLINQALRPKQADDAAVAQEALKTASVRMPDRDACAAELTAALGKAPEASKGTLLEIIAEVGGATALKTIGNAAKSKDDVLQDVGSRLLGKWNSVDAAPVLLDLAKTSPEEKYQLRGLRGYIGLVRKFPMPDAQRAEMCQKAFETAKQPAERKLVLDVLKLHANIETLKLAIKYVQIPELKDDATAAVLAISQKLSGKGGEVKELLAKVDFGKVKLEIVKAEYGAGANQRDVTEVLQKQVADLPMITLASDSYNGSFGGDPSPGSVKKLRVQYKINGKSAEATFDENALIVFPMPK